MNILTFIIIFLAYSVIGILAQLLLRYLSGKLEIKIMNAKVDAMAANIFRHLTKMKGGNDE